MTQGGETCAQYGDYLSWLDMEWVLHGQARIEMVNIVDPCQPEPSINVYRQLFFGMEVKL